MSKISDKANIATADAAPYHAHPAIFSDHVTSQCFLRPAPIACIENVPKRKATIKCESFARFQPMPRAVFGRANVYNRAFFVPFRSVFRHFNEFVVSSPSSTAIGTTTVLGNVPVISNTELVDLFLDGINLTSTSDQNGTFVKFSTSVGGVHDFKCSRTGLVFYITLNEQGIYLYKVLRSLGYPIYWNTDLPNSRRVNSLLPLLSFIKVHLDWYYPSAFAYSSVFAYFEEFFENASPSSTISKIQLVYFFINIAYCSYNQDYFTSSWTNPVGPNSTSFEGRYSIPDIANTYPYNSSSAANPMVMTDVTVTNGVNTNGTPSVQAGFGGNSPGRTFNGIQLNQYVIDSLRSLTDYTVRHRLSGVRAVDRQLAEVGVKLASELMKRSYYCGYSEFPCQFGDNYSQSDTFDSSNNTGARLGDYSGKGVAYDRGTFAYDAFDERGLYIVVNSVVPQVGYYQGYDRHVDHIYNLDFYHGDFDHLGVQAISVGEVAGMEDAVNYSGRKDNIFGYIPRYGEYLVYNDHVTGMPSLPSASNIYSGVYLQRDLKLVVTSSPVPNTPQQSLEFVLAQDYSQYKRLFYSSEQVDFIDFIHHFTIEFVDNCKDLFDTYDFEKAVNTVKMNINGTNLQ